MPKVQPKFSIIIAVAPWRDAEVLSSIAELDYPKENYEIIVKKGDNASRNRNQGAKDSKGKYLAFIDDDAKLSPNLLKEAELFFHEHPKIAIVGGPQLTPSDDNKFATISGFALQSRFGGWSVSRRYYQGKQDLDTDETSITSANLFCRREVMDNVQFREDLWPGEDPAFIAESKKFGYKVAYHPEMVIYHRRRNSLKALAKQVFNYGRTRTKKESFIETLAKPAFLVPSAFLIYLFFLCTLITPLTFHYPAKYLSLFYIPLALYIFLNLLNSIFISIKNSDINTLVYLPIIFLSIHLSYGWGIITGYLKN